jgi:YegS/Rv2252/BmrU family lipid kinase
MNKKHLVFIINPHSGTDRIKAVQSAIDAGIDTRIYTHETRYTEHARHGTELAGAAASAGAYAVIAVGGDGSVRDIALGLIGTGTALGIIAKGSGNGLARTLSLPLNTANAINVINAGTLQRIDVGYANDELFLSNAGVGFDALISDTFSRSRRRGLAAYSWLVTTHLWQYRELEWSVTIDGEEHKEEAFLVNVANGQQFGYNFKIAPLASYTDGLLDVTVIRRFPRLLGGTLALQAMNGTIHKNRYVKHYRAKEVIIRHPELHLMQTDGDAHPCSTSLTFRIMPAALTVIMP